MSISYDDFKKLDLRVAKILKIEEIPSKTKIVKGEIDLGDETRDVIIAVSYTHLTLPTNREV